MFFCFFNDIEYFSYLLFYNYNLLMGYHCKNFINSYTVNFIMKIVYLKKKEKERKERDRNK